MDPQVYTTLESTKNELSVTKRKLESKCEALLILSKELDRCQSERDQFKLMAEQVQERYQALRRSLAQGEAKMAQVDERRTKLTAQQLHSLLHESREANKTLQFEVEELKGKLQDAQGDIRVCREQLARQRVGAEESGIMTRHFPAHEREALVKQLEEAGDKFGQLERDLEQCLDEKEELVTERDVYKDKYERLNHELNYILKGDEKKIVDIDALVMENKYLRDRLQQMDEEKSLAMATVTKYKSMLERKKVKAPLGLGQARSGSVVISPKQVQELLSTGNQSAPTPSSMADLRSLAKALLDTVNDKNMALSHQRKTNKILGSRVAELERKLKTLEVSGLWNLAREHLGEDLSNTLERLKVECGEMRAVVEADEGAEEEDDDHLDITNGMRAESEASGIPSHALSLDEEGSQSQPSTCLVIDTCSSSTIADDQPMSMQGRTESSHDTDLLVFESSGPDHAQPDSQDLDSKSPPVATSNQHYDENDVS